MKEKINILNKDLLYLKLANYFEEISKKIIKKNGVFNLALSGGNSPKPFYILLSKLKTIKWANIHIFIVDERCVDINDENRNSKMIKESLIKTSNIKKENFHNLDTDLSDPAKSALNYEEELKKHFKEKEYPVFDLILLGIGDDGHTASLFPENKMSLFVKDKWVINIFTKNGKPPGNRITFTLPAINNARNILFLVKGNNKSKIINRIINKKDISLPAANVKPKGKLIWFIDEEAGSFLTF